MMSRDESSSISLELIRPGLRTEIVENQKLHAETLRLKLFAAAAIASLACGAFKAFETGVMGNSGTAGPGVNTVQGGQAQQSRQVLPLQIRELLVAIPAIALLADTYCIHLMMRVLVIAAFLRKHFDPYEMFVEELRSGPAGLPRPGGDFSSSPDRFVPNPFRFERYAVHGTTIGLCLLVALVDVVFLCAHPSEWHVRDGVILLSAFAGCVGTCVLSNLGLNSARSLAVFERNAKESLPDAARSEIPA